MLKGVINPIPSTTGVTANYVLTWNGTDLIWAAGGGGGGGSVISVIGLNTDNTDPANPVVKISVDGVTITGAGTPGSPLVATGSGSAVWGAITGTLSDQTDLQAALDAKVVANGAITGATKTKITYDAKGLVTAGADATTADIADSSNKRYVTDAQLVVIGNTSNTNSGDQTSIVGITGTKSQFDTACTDGNFLYVGDVTQYTDEMAQDAVGAMVNTSLTYTDGTPLLALTSRTINGVAYDATANITVTAAAGTLTGATLASGVTASSLTSLGTLTGLTMGGDIAVGANNITMTGTLGATGARLTKGWFTDLTVTNAIAGSVTGNAATVTTNANLTGPITSSGNATSIGSQTGTGNTFVMSASPTITTAALGSSTATTQAPSDNSTKLATTAYVDNAILGQNFKEATRVATTANLVGTYLAGVFTYTATGTDAIDGVTLALNDRVLVKNQTDNTQNGIYKVTTAGAIGIAGVLTRATDADQAGEFKTGDSNFVTAGTTQTSTTWAYTGADSPTIGTDAITYAQVAGQGSFTGGNGITITGTSIAIDTSVTVDKNTSQTLTNKTLTAPVMTAPVLGTPASGVATNLTGTAASLTAGAVTNATLTTALTVNTGTLTLTANSANTSVLTIGAGAVSVSGANTGDQTITLTGGVTGSGTGSFAATLATPGTLTVSSSNSNATAHTHAITSSSAPGAAASILATDSSGIIGSTGTRIVKGWFTDLTVTNAIAGDITGNAATVSSANEATDTTCFPVFITASGTQTLALKNNTGLTYNSNTNNLGATTFTGALAGNATTATALATARAIYGNNFDGSAALTQVIASTYGGTGNGFAKLSGPTTSEKTFTLPDASAAILTDNAAVTVAQGGTGRATGTTAYSLVATGTTATGAQQTLANGATTEILVGGGASALPVWTTAQGSGAPVRATSPTLTTPTIGVATATSVNFGQDALNYYDEGTWTAAITTDGTVGTPAYSVQVATFTRIGRQVFFQFDIQLSGWTGSPTGNVSISGLPFTSANTTNNYGGCNINTYVIAGLGATYTYMTARVPWNDTKVSLLQTSTNGTAAVTAAQVGTTAILIGSGMYHV